MSSVTPVPIIMDVDTGLDDALALLMAVRSPAVDLVAVTTVAGNVNVFKSTPNTLAMLHWSGAGSIPVHRGASRPLVEPIFDASDVHGVTGLGNALLPESPHAIGADRGPAAMIRLARQRPGELTLVCLGPLTNLAIALNVEPTFPSLLKRVVVMGGAFREPGNARGRLWAEFNIALDPDAAQQVFEASWPDITVIGLDVTHRATIDHALYDRIRATRNADGLLIGEILDFTFETRERDLFFMHDALALAVAVHPDLVACEVGAVTVDASGPERGATRFVPNEGRIEVAFGVDAHRFRAEYFAALGMAEELELTADA